MAGKIGTSLALLSVALQPATGAQIIPPPLTPCHAPAGVGVVVIPDGVPPVLADALHRELGPRIALPNESFNSTDVIVEGYPGSRFAFVWRRGKRWTVAAERGGIAYGVAIFLYQIDTGDRTARLRETHSVNPSSLCSTAVAIASKG